MSRFAMVPVEAAQDPRLTKNDLRILIALLSFCRKSKKCYPSKPRLADATGIPAKKISAITARLVSFGWLQKSGNGGRQSPAHYQVLNPLETSPKTGLVKDINQPQNGTKTSPKTGLPKEQSIEHNIPPYSPPIGIDENAWSDLDAYRTGHPDKRVRDNWNLLAKTKTVEILSGLDADQQRRCVNLTIANGWLGIFPERVRNETRRGNHRKSRLEAATDLYADVAVNGLGHRGDIPENEISLWELMAESERRESERNSVGDARMAGAVVPLHPGGDKIRAG